MTGKTESTNGRLSPPDITTNLLYLGVYAIALVIVERVLSFLDPSAPAGQAVIVVLVGATGAGVWIYRRSLYKILTSLPFAVAILIMLCGATVIGTIVIQGLGPDQLTQVYGSAAARVMGVFGLSNIFHSLWFGGLTALLAGALVLVVYKRKMWKPAGLGYLLAHLGVVVILVGGFIGFLTGFKGFIDIHEGQEVSSAFRTEGGVRMDDKRDLGFTVRLDRFEVDKYATGHRLYLYKLGKKDFEVSKSLSLDEARDWVKLSGGYDFRVTKAYPDFYQKTELNEVEPDKGRPALALTLKTAAGSEDTGLFAEALTAGGEPLVAGGPVVHFVWDPPTDEALAALAAESPEEHVVLLKTDPSGAAREYAVEVGKSYPVANGEYELTVLDYEPDFIYDTATKQPSSRSPNPNNPALQVSVKAAATGAVDKRWLFANMPDFSMTHGNDESSGPGLVYQYRPPRKPAADEVVIIGATRELIRLAAGEVVQRQPLGDESAGIPEIGAAAYKLYASAVESQSYGTRSDEMNNPVIVAELRKDGDTQTAMMAALHSEPLRVPDGRTVVTFEKKPDEVKAYRSKMTVLDDGKPVREQVVAVNHPLKYKGYVLYQASFKEEDPTYSGLQVVRDPGLPVVWLGFLMISLGVIYAYYVRPQVLKRRKANVV